MAKRQFAHPSGNGYVETVDPVICVVGIALLGALFLACKRAWGAALLSIPLQAVLLAVALLIGSTSGWLLLGAWVAFSLALGWMLTPSISQAYLKRGWTEVAA